MQPYSNVRKLTESALCVGVATVLSLVVLFTMPLGGSVTPFSTLPIILVSLRHGSKWGVGSALVFSLLQLTLGMSNVVAVPVQTIWHMGLCALLDYVLAYNLLGFTGYFARTLSFGKPVIGLVCGVLLSGLGRMVCSFISGVVIWAPYAPEGWNMWVYSLAYNAAWCVPDVAIVLVACLALAPIVQLGILPKMKTVAVGDE